MKNLVLEERKNQKQQEKENFNKKGLDWKLEDVLYSSIDFQFLFLIIKIKN
mgnify:CR=1 FL=1